MQRRSETPTQSFRACTDRVASLPKLRKRTKHRFQFAKPSAAVSRGSPKAVQLQTLQALAMSQHQRRAVVAAGAAAALLYFYKRRQPPEGATLIKDVLDDQECQTLETLLRDLLKKCLLITGQDLQPRDPPSLQKTEPEPRDFTIRRYVDKNRVQNACVAPLPPALLRVARRLKKLGIV